MNRIIKFIINRKKFILYTLLKFTVMLLGLVTNIMIIRKFTVNDFGIYSVIFMLIGLLTTFGFSWSSSSILYFGSKEISQEGNLNKTFWARNIIMAISMVITALLFFVFRQSINNYIGLEVAHLVLFWLLISVVEDYLIQYFLAVKKQIISSLLSITAKVIFIILLLIFSYDIETLIWLNIASHSTVILYVLGIDKKDIGKFEFDKLWFKEILIFSLWQLFGFSGLYLINFGDIVVIKHFMTSEDVGVYNAAYKLFNSIASFAFVISSYYASTVSRMITDNDKNEIKIFFYKERVAIILLSIFAHIIVMVFSRQIILTLYGDKYSQSVIIFNILMIGSMIRYSSVFYMLFYNTNKMYKKLQYLNILRAVINIVLDIIFISIFGLIGPAIATTLAMVITFVIMVFDCEKKIYRKTSNQNRIGE